MSPPLPGTSQSAQEVANLDSKQFLKVKEGPLPPKAGTPPEGQNPRGTQDSTLREPSPGGLGAQLQQERFARRPESPRLPPLDSNTVSLWEEAAGQEAEVWKSAHQADMARIMGGAGLRGDGGFSLAAASRGEAPAPKQPLESPGYPLARPADFVPFWRRDPMDSRPSMPMMPPANHPAQQLSLIGRSEKEEADNLPPDPASATSSLMPRPPSSDRPAVGTGRRPPEIDRAVYPRRSVRD